MLFKYLSLKLLFCVLLAITQACSTPPAVRTPAGDPKEQKIIFFLLDGTNERIFHEMLEAGELPYLKKLQEGTLIEGHKGFYTKATSVWPSTTGPTYAPFLMGIYPFKSGLSGIRQYLRDQGVFRSYPGSDIHHINNDLTKDFATIYEVLGVDETYNQQGFVTRRGWKENGQAISPKHQNQTAISGLHNKGIFFGAGKNHVANDLRNLQAFMAHVSPRLNFKFEAERAFFSLDEKIIDSKTEKIAVTFSGFLEKFVFQGRGLGHLPKFSFVGLHAPDTVSHELGTNQDYREALRKTDLMIGGVVKYFTMRGEIDNITFIFSSDHGTDSVEEGPQYHAPIIKRLAADTGLPLHDSLKRFTFGFAKKWKTKQQEFSGIAAVSGNANVQLYLKGSCDGCKTVDLFKTKSSHGQVTNFVSTLANYPEVAQVFSKDLEKNHFFMTSALGQVRIEAKDDTYRYVLLSGRDPLELSSPMALEMIEAGQFYSGDQWAEATKDTNYPDCVVQIVQLLKAERSGDIIFDAAPGFEPWDEMQSGLHGSLRREHMMIPLLISSPRLDQEKAAAVLKKLGRYPRSVDMYPTMLKLLGVELPETIKFEGPRKFKVGPRKTYEVPVRTDIDGIELDIWD